VALLEVGQVVQLVLAEGGDDFGVRDDVHDALGLCLELVERLDDLLLLLAELLGAVDLLAVGLALEFALEALDKGDHVGLAVAEQVDLGLQDIVVRVLVARLEKVEQREDEVPVQLADEAPVDVVRRGLVCGHFLLWSGSAWWSAATRGP
jgi:hypothetical protein